MTAAFHKLRYTEGACLTDNDRHVKRWIILRTFPKCFFIVVSNYGFAFTNQFSRCSAINFRANWDISCCSGARITSHHITSHHQGRQKKHERSPPQQLMWSDMRFASLGFDPFKQVKVFEERTHLMSDDLSVMWNIKRLFYCRIIDTEECVKMPR